MRRLSRLGAAALAMALSLTMVAPISANAYVERKYNAGDGTEANPPYYEYTNTDTKKTISTKDIEQNPWVSYYEDYQIEGSRIENFLKSKTRQISISTNMYTHLTITTRSDSKKMENFKSNKKALKVKVVSKLEKSVDPSIAEHDYDYKDKALGTYYYKDVNGDIKSTTNPEELPKDSGFGQYKVRLFTKKAGTYKLSWNVILEDGSTVKKTLKVVAKEDGEPIKSVTYAGKLIYATDKSTYVSTFVNKDGMFTTKNKGKLKITANKDFKIKKIEIGSAFVQTRDYNNGNTKGTKVYGRDEKTRESITWKTVKNGKTIKLNSVNNNVDDYNITRYDEDGKQIATELKESKYDVAMTFVRVTYYDKKNKRTERVQLPITINRLINK